MGNAIRAVHTVGDDGTSLRADLKLSPVQPFVSGGSHSSTWAIELHWCPTSSATYLITAVNGAASGTFTLQTRQAAAPHSEPGCRSAARCMAGTVIYSPEGAGGKEREGRKPEQPQHRESAREEKKKAVIVQLHAPRRETMSNIQRDISNVQSARNHARDDEHDGNG